MARLNPGIIMLLIGVALLAVGWAISSSVGTQFLLDGGDFQFFQILFYLNLAATTSGLTLTILGIRRAVRRTERGWTIDIF